MSLKVLFVYLFFAATLLVSFPSSAQSSSQQDTLNQYVADLQKNPDDNAIREKIIKLAREMKPVPVIPAEAENFSDRAEYAVKTAKTETDFADAAKEYEKALLIAPWVAEYYFNFGLMQEKSSQPQKAANSFTLYLVAEPNSKDVRDVRKRIAGLEYAAEKVAKESSPEAVAAKEENEYDVWLKNLDGARFLGAPREDAAIGHEGEYMFGVYFISGQEARSGWIEGVRSVQGFDFKSAPIRQVDFNDGTQSKAIQNKQFMFPLPSFMNASQPCVATISDDGQFLTEQCPGSGIPITYTRVK